MGDVRMLTSVVMVTWGTKNVWCNNSWEPVRTPRVVIHVGVWLGLTQLPVKVVRSVWPVTVTLTV